MKNKIYTEVWQDIITFLLKNGLDVLAGILVFFIFLFISIFINKILFRISKKFNKEKKAVVNLTANFSKTTLLLIGGISALGTMGINVNALIAGLGLTGFALGFALKDSLSNLLSGLLILFYRPFKVGDNINVDGFKGTVENIDLRYTILENEEGKILLPNTLIFTKAVTIFKKY